jgi:hypothetical protein
MRVKEVEPRRLAYSPIEVGELLGVSVDFVERRILPDLRVIRKGRKVLIPVASIESWVDREAAAMPVGRRRRSPSWVHEPT